MASSAHLSDIVPAEMLLEALWNDPLIFIGVSDAGGYLRAVNPAGPALFGYADADLLIGRPWTQLLAPGGETVSPDGWEGEIKCLSRDGGIRYGYLSLRPLPGAAAGMLLIQIRLIDAYKQTELTLAREKQRFEALFNHATMGILVANESGEIELANHYALREFGYTTRELTGKKIEMLIPERFRPNHTSYRDSYHEHPQIRPMGAGRDLFARRKDGTEFPVEISLSPYRAGEKLLIIAFIIDISVRKEKEAAEKRHHEQINQVNATIRKMNDALEQKVADRTRELEKTLHELKESRDEISQSLQKEKELNDMKSRFVSMASHEFRTPLSTILSSASLLSKYPKTEDQSKRDKHVLRIKSAVNTLTGILQEFLSLGKMEDGMLRAHFTSFSLPELLNTVCAEMEEMKKPQQRIQYSHTGESLVRQDPDLLRNVLVNLLSNAIKFSPENGRVEIRSSLDDQHLIHIAIRDEGIGIPEADQIHLFERFFRSSNAVHIQGTGLGLHIVSKYLELMDGLIRFDSKPGQGTEFFLTFKQPKSSGSASSG